MSLGVTDGNDIIWEILNINTESSIEPFYNQLNIKYIAISVYIY